MGPVTNLVEQARDKESHGRAMSRQRQLMFQIVVRRVRAIADDLRFELPDFDARVGDDGAAYTLFFEQFLGQVEETAKRFAAHVVEELTSTISRQIGYIKCTIPKWFFFLIFQANAAHLDEFWSIS